MTEVLLRVENLHVSVGDTPIIQGISLEMNRGEIHAIMGRNGAGKSTLANVIMGHPAYQLPVEPSTTKGEHRRHGGLRASTRRHVPLVPIPAAIPASRLEPSFVSPLHPFEARPHRQGRFGKNSMGP